MDSDLIRGQRRTLQTRQSPDEGETPRLSIVVQGPIKRETDAAGFSTSSVLASARQHYPQAELIYSGWQQDEIPREVRALADKVVLSPDPGAVNTFITSAGAVRENINRQIVSTVAGLKAGQHNYAMKLRSDTLITGNRIAKWLAFQRRKGSQTPYLAMPIVAASQYTRLYFFEYGGFQPSIGHLSDLFFFGLRSDLLALWDGELITTSQCSLREKYEAATAEQLLMTRFLAKAQLVDANVRIDSKFARKLGHLTHSAWVDVLHSNFVVLDEDDLGVRHPRRFVRRGLSTLLFETDRSIAAARGSSGYASTLAFYGAKAVVYLEYQVKRAIRAMLGIERYRAISKLALRYLKR
jgi:hypothetical protein